MLLEGLDSVDWSRLTCTVGTAEHVPGLLRRLTAPSPKVRRAALWKLTDDFYHQATVWKAAVAAVPFLIELLGAPEVGGKADLLRLLGYLAEGYYSDFDASATGTNSEAGDEANEDEEEGTRADSEADNSQPQRTAIRAGIPIYLALLDDPAPAVRIASVRLLMHCRSAAFDPRAPLEAASERERNRDRDPAVSICLLLALGQLRQEGEEQLAFYTDALQSPARSAGERVAAALEVAKMTKAEAPDEAINTLVNTLARPSRRLDAAYDLADGGWGLSMSIGRILSELPPARLEAAVPILTAMLPRIGRMRPHAVAKILLAALFAPTGGAPLPAISLTDEQRAALVALFAAESYWRNGTFSETRFGEYGLPETRPALANYLGLELPPEDALGAIEQPQQHRPLPFTRKAYQAQVHRRFGYIRLRRDMGYRFETGPDFDLYSPSVVYLFIFPKTPEAVLALEREAVVLNALWAMQPKVDLLAGLLPTKLPIIGWNPYWSSRDTRAAGRAFMGRFGATDISLTPEVLEQVRGTPRWAQIAGRLAEFLRDLHATPLDSIPIVLPAAEGKETWQRVYVDLRSRFFDYLPDEVRRHIANEFEALLAEPSNWTWEPVLIHGNFTSRNILRSTYSGSELYLQGIQGWEYVRQGDPAADLASLLGSNGYGEEFVRHFAEAYPSLDAELPRARFYAWARPFRDALTVPDGQESEAAKNLLANYLDTWKT